METDERKTIEGLKRGEEWAYRLLFDVHFSSLCRTAYLYLGDVFLAEAVVSDVIYHIWEIRKGLRIDSSLDRFLSKCVRNRCRDHLRKAYVGAEIPIPEGGEDCLKDGGAQVDCPFGTLLASDLRSSLVRAIETLPEKSRLVFEMSRFEGLGRKEIACRLGISVNTVKFHLKKASAALRGSLADHIAVFLGIFINFL